MATHKYDHVNPLVNPVASGDRIISETGQVLIVRQGMTTGFWLEYANGDKLTHPVDGQVAICSVIQDMANI